MSSAYIKHEKWHVGKLTLIKVLLQIVVKFELHADLAKIDIKFYKKHYKLGH